MVFSSCRETVDQPVVPRQVGIRTSHFPLYRRALHRGAGGERGHVPDCAKLKQLRLGKNRHGAPCMAATPRPSVDCTSRACSSDPGERGRVRSRDPGREPAHSVSQRFGHRLSISLSISVHLERLTSRQDQQRGLNRYAALDRPMCPEFVMGTSLSVHMHMCTNLGPDAASKQVWPQQGRHREERHEPLRPPKRPSRMHAANSVLACVLAPSHPLNQLSGARPG